MPNPDTLIVTCEKCSAKNRLPRHRLQDHPRCGRCKAPLPDPALEGRVDKLTDARFESEVLKSPLPVVVDFWAPWCAPCRTVAPVLDGLAREFAGQVKIVKINVDENPQASARFGIRSIPSLLIFTGGRLVETLVGAQPREVLEQRLRRLL